MFTAAAAHPGSPRAEETEEVRPALLVIDVQNKWMPMMAEEDRQAAPERINELIALFREHGHPVIRVYHSGEAHGPEPGTEDFEFPAMFRVTGDDPMIVKQYPSSFTKTELEKLLRSEDRNVAVLCGLSATGCVLATYFGAIDRGFDVVMVKGSLLSHNADYTKVIEEICYSMTVEEVRDIMENPRQ
jgi:nicotinamidase-related amidase